MEYVMVPVPEEHLAAVSRFLQWNVGKPPAIDGWDEDAIRRFLATLDDRSRELLLLTAASSVEVDVLTIGDAAQRLGCSTNELLGMTWALNDGVRVAGGSPFAIVSTPAPESPDAGPASWGIHMAGSIAEEFLRAAGRPVPQEG